MKHFIITVMFLFTAALWCNTELVELAIGTSSVEEGVNLLQEFNELDNNELAKGIIFHNLSNIEENREWVNNAIDLLGNSFKKDKDPLALGFLGSAKTILASYYYNENSIIKSLVSLEEGVKEIDRAVELSNKNITLRFLRLLNSIEIAESSPIDRSMAIDEDITFLEKSSLNKRSRSELLYYKSRYLIFIDDIEGAIESLEASIKADPGSIYSSLSEDLLLEWEE